MSEAMNGLSRAHPVERPNSDSNRVNAVRFKLKVRVDCWNAN